MLNFKKYFNLFENTESQYKFVIVGGVHGDEPAGNIAADYFKNKDNIYVFSHINKSHKRRFNGKDLNRHFDQNGQTKIQKDIISKIEEIKPLLVICLHEDDSLDGIYAYSTPKIKDKIKECLADVNFKKMKFAHHDKTDGGVIFNGKMPVKGTLEKALAKRNIDYSTIETPIKQMPVEDRAKIMVKLVKGIISTY